VWNLFDRGSLAAAFSFPERRNRGQTSMTTLMALLPVAISGLVGVIVGFHYARKEREQNLQFAKHEKEHEDSQRYLPFVTIH
jgi:hypothetical protein